MTSDPPYLLIGLLVLAGLWMLGAYNRLVALRNKIGSAWARVDEALRLRDTAAGPLLQALHEPMAAEQGALQAVEAALEAQRKAATQMTARPVVVAHAAAWASCEAVVGSSAARLFALLEHHRELAREPAVAAATTQWRDAEARLRFSRQLFNEAAEAYDSAIAQFPTRLLLPMFRFGQAGRL